MKLSTLFVLFGSTLAITANIVARQGRCSEDDCFRAVWGTFRGPDHPLTALRDCMSRLTTTVAIFPVYTITVVGRTTTTAVVSCSATPTSTTLPSLTASASSYLRFTSPTLTAISTESAVDRIKVRQNEVLSSSTTTIVAPIPTYAGNNCFNSGPVYASICSCKGVTRDILTKLSTILTSTDTLILTSTVTSTASCSTSSIVTLSHSSSTIITTVTMTSNPKDTSTGTGTTSSSSTSPTSISSSLNTTITSSSSSTYLKTCFTSFSNSTTPSTIPITRSTSLNTTLTSSITTTTTSASVCNGLSTITCNGTCHNAATDTRHCGRCGNACARGLDCINGVCARKPCDSSCTFDRFCNPGNSTSSGCICATDASGHGICFDKDRYQCSNRNLTRCLQTEASNNPSDLGCPIGHVCIKDLCNCHNTDLPDAATLGICVSTAGCEDSGTTSLGPLVRIEEQEKRRRLVGNFNW